MIFFPIIFRKIIHPFIHSLTNLFCAYFFIHSFNQSRIHTFFYSFSQLNFILFLYHQLTVVLWDSLPVLILLSRWAVLLTILCRLHLARVPVKEFKSFSINFNVFDQKWYKFTGADPRILARFFFFFFFLGGGGGGDYHFQLTSKKNKVIGQKGPRS